MKLFILVLVLFNLNCTSAQSTATVFEVAKSGTVQASKEIVRKDETSFMTFDERGFSPLIIATYSANNEVAKFIIRYSEIDYVSPMGTALMAAVVKGNEEIVENLLSNNANPNLTDSNGSTALMYAVQFKNRVIIELLLRYNADKEIVDKNGRTAFEIAVNGADETIITLLK